MADTVAGEQLTELHRVRQLELRAATLNDVLRLWPAFDLDDIDGSWPALEAGLFAVIRDRRRTSSDLAANYYRAFRLIEGVPGEAAVRIAAPPADGLIRATLKLLGPIAAKKAVAARRPRVAEDTLTRLAGSTARQVLDGGRTTLAVTARADRAARGWRRVTDGSPCDFCTDIAREGVVSLDRNVAAAHDHCGCSAEVAFTA